MDKGWVTYRVGTNLREAQERDERKGGGRKMGVLNFPLVYLFLIKIFIPIQSDCFALWLVSGF